MLILRPISFGRLVKLASSAEQGGTLAAEITPTDTAVANSAFMVRSCLAIGLFELASLENLNPSAEQPDHSDHDVYCRRYEIAAGQARTCCPVVNRGEHQHRKRGVSEKDQAIVISNR